MTHKRFIGIVFFTLVAMTGCPEDDRITDGGSRTILDDDDTRTTCEDGVQNGDETGVDCGGGACAPCSSEGSCFDGIRNRDEQRVDCGGQFCVDCDVVTCNDGRQNGDETGTDCGGTLCPACDTITCDDGLQNGNETGRDCGGDCPACATCNDNIQNQGEEKIDCGGLNCPACPSCDDGQQNGDETGRDCGGPCGPCPTCFDGVQNGDEEAVDCGGPTCSPCQPDLATCDDGFLNGGEAGIDCGGTCGTSCGELWQGDICSRTNDQCDDTYEQDQHTCTYVQEIDLGHEVQGVCREEECAGDGSDCDPGSRCITLYETVATGGYTINAPESNATSKRFCVIEPEPTSLWQVQVTYVRVSDEIDWGFAGANDIPDIAVCFEIEGESGWECRYDATQYDDYEITNLGSIIVEYQDLERIGVHVLDDDFGNGGLSFSTDDKVASDFFDIRPAGRLLQDKDHVFKGDANTFSDNVGLEAIEMRVFPRQL